MPCVPEAVTAYVDGEVDSRRAKAIAHHLALCLVCSGQFAFERELRARLQEVPEPQPVRHFYSPRTHPLRAPFANIRGKR